MLMHKLITAKQATDLHTSHFTQSIMFQYLCDNDADEHIRRIREVYGRQCQAMQNSIQRYFPSKISYTNPTAYFPLIADVGGPKI
jgi:2-aminoadipate transaminase